MTRTVCLEEFDVERLSDLACTLSGNGLLGAYFVAGRKVDGQSGLGACI